VKHVREVVSGGGLQATEKGDVAFGVGSGQMMLHNFAIEIAPPLTDPHVVVSVVRSWRYLRMPMRKEVL